MTEVGFFCFVFFLLLDSVAKVSLRPIHTKDLLNYLPDKFGESLKTQAQPPLSNLGVWRTSLVESPFSWRGTWRRSWWGHADETVPRVGLRRRRSLLRPPPAHIDASWTGTRRPWWKRRQTANATCDQGDSSLVTTAHASRTVYAAIPL